MPALPLLPRIESLCVELLLPTSTAKAPFGESPLSPFFRLAKSLS